MRQEKVMAAATRRGLLMVVALLLAMVGVALAAPAALEAIASLAGAQLYGL